MLVSHYAVGRLLFACLSSGHRYLVNCIETESAVGRKVELSFNFVQVM